MAIINKRKPAKKNQKRAKQIAATKGRGKVSSYTGSVKEVSALLTAVLGLVILVGGDDLSKAFSDGDLNYTKFFVAVGAIFMAMGIAYIITLTYHAPKDAIKKVIGIRKPMATLASMVAGLLTVYFVYIRVTSHENLEGPSASNHNLTTATPTNSSLPDEIIGDTIGGILQTGLTAGLVGGIFIGILVVVIGQFIWDHIFEPWIEWKEARKKAQAKGHRKTKVAAKKVEAHDPQTLQDYVKGLGKHMNHIVNISETIAKVMESISGAVAKCISHLIDIARLNKEIVSISVLVTLMLLIFTSVVSTVWSYFGEFLVVINEQIDHGLAAWQELWSGSGDWSYGNIVANSIAGILIFFGVIIILGLTYRIANAIHEQRLKTSKPKKSGKTGKRS